MWGWGVGGESSGWVMCCVCVWTAHGRMDRERRCRGVAGQAGRVKVSQCSVWLYLLYSRCVRFLSDIIPSGLMSALYVCCKTRFCTVRSVWFIFNVFLRENDDYSLISLTWAPVPAVCIHSQQGASHNTDGRKHLNGAEKQKKPIGTVRKFPPQKRGHIRKIRFDGFYYTALQSFIQSSYTHSIIFSNNPHPQPLSLSAVFPRHYSSHFPAHSH